MCFVYILHVLMTLFWFIETRLSTCPLGELCVFAQEMIYVRIHHSEEENKEEEEEEEEEEDVKAFNVLNRGPCARKCFDLLLSFCFWG